VFKEKSFDGAYVKFEKIYLDKNWVSANSDIYSDATKLKEFNSKESYDVNVHSRRTYRYFNKYNLPTVSGINHNIQNNLFINKTYQGAVEGNSAYEHVKDWTFVNNSVSIPLHLLKLQSGTEALAPLGDWRNKAFFGSIRQFKDVFSNLYTIQYKKLQNKTLYATNLNTSFIVLGGDTSVSRLSLMESSFKQTGIVSDTTPTTLDAYSVFFSFPTQDTYFNPEFRSSAKDQKLDYFKNKNASTTADNLEDMFSYVLRKLYSPDVKDVIINPEIYNYNNSFSFLDGLEIKYPIAFNYKFCNLCIEDHPYRIWYSQKDDNTSLEDKSRIILPNNYTDELGGNSGPVTDLFVSFNKLYATTPKSIFYIPTRPQNIETDVNTIYLGTGEVLGVPPQEMKNSMNGFGGQQHWSSRLLTEYGAFYMDSFSGSPIMLGGSIEDISMSGMRNFFQENGEFNLPKQFKLLTNQEYPFISHVSPVGFGYKSVYDPRYKRLILTKKDHKIKANWISKFLYYPTTTDNPGSVSVANDRLWFNNHSFYYKDKTGTNNKVSLEDSYFFENKSFTLSYYFLSKHWVSFHSYIPTYSFSDSNSFYSQKDYTNIYKHGELNYQKYYDIKYPHIVDVILTTSPPIIKTAGAVVLCAYSSSVDVNSNTFQTETPYSKVIFYNSSQSSGVQSLVAPSPFQLDVSNGVAFTKLTDRQWRINNIRDLTVSNNQPIWASDWNSIQSSPFSYIDKIPNLANINYSKSFFNSSRLKDYYLGGRFFFEPSTDVKVSLDLLMTTTQNKQR